MAFDRSISGTAQYRLYQNPSIDWLRFPPLPQMIVMTDRADGKRWLLSHNTSHSTPDGHGHVSINDTFIDNGDIVEFGPYEGPVVNDAVNEIKLLIRGGRLGYEVEPATSGIRDRRQMRVLSRKGLTTDFREIIVPAGWLSSPDVLGWTFVET